MTCSGIKVEPFKDNDYLHKVSAISINIQISVSLLAAAKVPHFHSSPADRDARDPRNNDFINDTSSPHGVTHHSLENTPKQTYCRSTDSYINNTPALSLSLHSIATLQFPFQTQSVSPRRNNDRASRPGEDSTLFFQYMTEKGNMLYLYSGNIILMFTHQCHELNLRGCNDGVVQDNEH